MSEPADGKPDEDAKPAVQDAKTDPASRAEASAHGEPADAKATDTKADTKGDPSAEPKPEPDAKPEPKADAKPEPEPKADAKPEPKAEPKPETKPEPKADAKPDAKPEPKAGVKTDAKAGTKPETEVKTIKVRRPAADSGVVTKAADIPPTRQHEVPARPSGLSLTPPITYPDDGSVSRGVRKLDGYLGIGEQVLLVAILAAVVCTAAAAAISDKVIGHQLGRWWFDIVRGGTFSVAMMGAVFATHQQRHLAMDLISKRLPPRGRLVLRVILGGFTIAIALLLLRSGLHQLDTVGEEGGEHFISTRNIVMFMPAGAGLIIIHTLLHMVIDVDYLARGVLPPERARSGH